MNRLIRGILYIVAGCAGIGCAALVLGLVFGRDSVDSVAYDDLHQAKDTAYTILARVEDRLRGWMGRTGQEPQSTFQEKSDASDVAEGAEIATGVVLDRDGVTGVLSASTDQVKKLDIELAHGYLEISPADSEQVWVGTDSPEEDISVTCKGDTVTVRDNRKGSERREDASIYLTVPEDAWFKDIDVQVDAGVLQAESLLMAKHMELNADAGDIYVKELVVDDLDVSVGAGSVLIEEGTYSKKVKLDCGVGTVELFAVVMDADAELSCGMGSISLELANADTRSADYVINCGLGNVDIGGESYSGLSHEKRIDNDAGHTIKLDCGMGSIAIY